MVISSEKRRRVEVSAEVVAVMVAAFEREGSIGAAARAAGCAHSTARRHLVRAGLVQAEPMPLGKPRQRAEFDELIASGVHNAVAARRVGVTLDTGRYWMRGVRKSHGRTIYPDGRVTGPPAKRAARNRPMIEVVGTGRLLSLQDRLVIADGLINRESVSYTHLTLPTKRIV